MKCLIVCDDAARGFLAEQAVARVGCESQTIDDPRAALRAALDGSGTQVVIVDHAPPHIDALAWCAELRRDDDRRDRRVILLLPSDEPFDLRRVADTGVDDLLVKPFQAIELELRLQSNLRIVELEAQVEAGNRALRAQATHDLLTGVLNQKAIDDALRRECERASRERAALSAILLEVDELRTIREWTGAEAADAVLVEVAARVRSSLRPYDSLGRSGTATFLASLPRCDLSHALSVAKRILQAVSGAPVRGAGRMVSITASIGVAGLEVADEFAADRLEAAVVAALASAHMAGGNRVATPPGAAPA